VFKYFFAVNIESGWHLIFGGYTPSTGVLDSVELYNWKTSKQCNLLSLPSKVYGQSAVVMDGTPVFCGGQNDIFEAALQCYKLEKNTKNWTPVSCLKS
jgi:hypothetical protein